MADVVLTRTILQDIVESYDRFEDAYFGYVDAVLEEARFMPQFSRPRLREVHHFWNNDLQRLEAHEADLTHGLDHFKCCGHLAYWLRRCAPMTELLDVAGAYLEEIRDLEPGSKRLALRNLLQSHTNEYLAFDWAFQICLFYEQTKPPSGNPRAKAELLTEDYVRTICHFLKSKNVSPHALFLVFKSLFV